MLPELRRITQSIHSASNLQDALQQVASDIHNTLSVDCVYIFLANQEKGKYVLMGQHGNPVVEQHFGKITLNFGQGIVGQVGERGEPINLADAKTDPHYKGVNQLNSEQYAAFLGVPLIEQGELLGVIVLRRVRAEAFSEDEEAFLITLAIQLASEIEPTRVHNLFASSQRKRSGLPKVLDGISGAPGVALGRAVIVYPPADLEVVPERQAEDAEQEIQAFRTALEGARVEIEGLQVRARKSLSVTEQVLFDAYLRILDSRSLMEEVVAEIQGNQLWAPSALKHVIKRHVAQFEALEDPYLRERATDFRDLGRRILAHMQQEERALPDYPKKTILVSEEVTAAALMEVPEGCLLGVVSTTGSKNSHIAILARAMGIPTVLGVSVPNVVDLEKKELIVDGYNGQVYISPAAAVKKEFRHLLEEEEQLAEELAELRDLPAVTKDKHAVPLYVNTGLMTDASQSLTVGAEGVGLYRTELPFMLRARFPSEEEQRVMYQQLLNAFAPKPVVMRTLDIGGDKNLPYFSVDEANPFLGWRGIRISLDYPQIFLQQLRAMLQASVDLDNLSIMFPMVSSVSETERALSFVTQAYDELVNEGWKVKMPKLGLMIEVPAAVYQAKALAQRVDFLSVGSNDLIQYLLAVDRNNAQVADLYDSFHPAVLQALRMVVEFSHKAGKPVSICGEMASQPIAVMLLVAMGFDSLSMNARAIPRIKWIIRNFTLKHAKELLKEVLVMDDPREVREHMELALTEAGLAGVIRAGK